MSSILITGGSGSFGQAFVTRLLKTTNDYDRIAVLSRSEHKQAEMRDSLAHLPYAEDKLRWFIGDVRDVSRLRRAFDGVDVVVHAAALKRIEVGMTNTDEMILTNVGGTMNVIEAAFDAKVSKVVGLSSDKAYRPISPYGQTKALGETLFLTANNRSNQTDTSRPLGPKFSVTRYGNVSGSAGSIIPKWRMIVSKGHGVVPVTDPDATRFWMLLDEAVDLVLEAIRFMPTHSPVIPQLPAYRIGDLAEALGAKMKITGLPDWEKKHEGMADGNTSDIARRMSVDELRERLREV